MGKVDLEALRRKSEEIKARSTGNFWVPAEGENMIRVLPPWPGSNAFYFEMFSHWVQIASRGSVCLQRHYGQACFLCEEVQTLRKEGDRKAARALSPQSRYLLNIIDLKDPGTGVQLFNACSSVFQDIAGYCLDPDWGDVTDPEVGFDLAMERISQTGVTNYNVRPRRNPTPLADMKWLEDLQDLSKIIEPDTYEIQRELLGVEAPASPTDGLPFDEPAPGKDAAKPEAAAK